MVRTIRRYGLTDSAVLAAMTAVPRHEFVPRSRLSAAYDDNPLPIGYGQTISQPYIVAEMTRQLQLKPTSRVLEIGTGSGYQAAVLTEFTRHVYSIEIVEPLATSAAKRLKLPDDLDRVVVYPNPFIPSQSLSGYITFKNLSENVTIEVYNLAG